MVTTAFGGHCRSFLAQWCPVGGAHRFSDGSAWSITFFRWLRCTVKLPCARVVVRLFFHYFARRVPFSRLFFLFRLYLFQSMRWRALTARNGFWGHRSTDSLTAYWFVFLYLTLAESSVLGRIVAGWLHRLWRRICVSFYTVLFISLVSELSLLPEQEFFVVGVTLMVDELRIIVHRASCWYRPFPLISFALQRCPEGVGSCAEAYSDISQCCSLCYVGFVRCYCLVLLLRFHETDGAKYGFKCCSFPCLERESM